MLQHWTIFISLLLPISIISSPVPSKGNDTVKCGVPAIKPDTMTKIVGGKDAIPYSWPWQVALMIEYTWAGESFQFCAGTIISEQWIMTAGHCFYGETSTESYRVRAGVYNKNKDNEPGEQILKISEIHVNPKYDPRTTHFDITLLKLETPLNFSDHVSPICLPVEQDEEMPKDGSGVYVTGWGDTVEGGMDSATLKQVVVPLVNTDVCKKHYDQIHLTVYGDTMFCAGLDEGGKDSCQGDSGGPVVYQDPENGVWKQLGITSWGLGCAEPNFYGVYSKVSAYIDFIHEYVKDV